MRQKQALGNVRGSRRSKFGGGSRGRARKIGTMCRGKEASEDGVQAVSSREKQKFDNKGGESAIDTTELGGRTTSRNTYVDVA